MNVRMSTLKAVVLTVAVLAVACGKDSDGGTGPSNDGDLFYRFDANGTRVTYTVQQSLLGSFSRNNNQRVLIITGFNANSNSALQVYSGADIGVGSYSGYTINPAQGVVIGTIMHYQDSNGVLYATDSSVNPTDVVTITDLTATTVRGTFSGRLKSAGRPDMVITNGEFLVKRN